MVRVGRKEDRCSKKGYTAPSFGPVVQEEKERKEGDVLLS